MKSIIEKVLIYILTILIIFFGCKITFPYIYPFLEEATSISTAVSFSNNNALFLDKLSDNNEDDDDLILNQFEFSDTEFPIESKEDITEQTQKPTDSESNNTDENNDTGLSFPVENGEKPTSCGTVIHTLYQKENTTQYIALKNGYIRNVTSLKNSEVEAISKQKTKITMKCDGSPEVLLYHTHATECYLPKIANWYNLSTQFRTTDNSANMTKVGDEIEKQLKAAGIGVIHSYTLHDYPSYTGAYNRSRETIAAALKKYPTIKVVLDIHRDGISPSATSAVACSTKINDKPAAQVMIISGCDNGSLNMPNFRENLKFASLFQSTMEKDYPTLTRPILFDYRKYNQDMTIGSLLLEVGSHGNSLDEARYTGQLIGKSLSKTLLSLKG